MQLSMCSSPAWVHRFLRARRRTGWRHGDGGGATKTPRIPAYFCQECGAWRLSICAKKRYTLNTPALALAGNRLREPLAFTAPLALAVFKTYWFHPTTTQWLLPPVITIIQLDSTNCQYQTRNDMMYKEISGHDQCVDGKGVACRPSKTQKLIRP
jgi:hypothetical protein